MIQMEQVLSMFCIFILVIFLTLKGIRTKNLLKHNKTKFDKTEFKLKKIIDFSILNKLDKR